MTQGKITLALLVVCLLLAGTGYLLKQHARTVKQAADRKGRVFDGVTSDRIKRVKITGAEREFEFAREGGRWMIEKPFKLRAEQGEIDNLLYAIEYLEQKRKISAEDMSESKTTLADYGLEKPRLTLEFVTEQRQHQVDIGHENRQSDGIYVRVDGGAAVRLVGRSLVEKLEQPLDQWRDRSVLDLADAQVARVEIKSPKRAIEFARQGDAWRIVQPLNGRASSHAIDALVEGITSLRAEKFLSEEGGDLKKFHLDEPRYEVVVKTDKGGETGQSLLIGAPAGEQLWSAARKGAGSIVAIPAKFVSALDGELKDFRDSQLLHVDKRDVEAIEVRQGEKTIRAELIDGGWKITQPKPAAADRELIEQFLARFTGLNIQEFTTDVLTEAEKYGLGDRAPSVRLLGKTVEKGKEAPVLADVRIGLRSPKKPLRYVKRSDESSVYGVFEEDARFIPASPLDLEDRVFLTLAKDAIREVRLKTGGKAVAATRTEKGDWVSEGTLDRPVLDKIIADLSRMMAIRLVSEGGSAPDAKYGLSRPVGELIITEKNGDEKVSHEIIVGPKVDGKVYVFYKNRGLLAEIPVVVGEELTTPFIKK